MKKLEKYISKSELIFSIFLVIAITFSVVFSLYLYENREPSFEMTEIALESRRDYKKIELGSYEIRKYRRVGASAHSFEVKSGEDFYNEIIKKNSHYDSALDFVKEGYISYGYMWNDFYLYHYEISSNLVLLDSKMFGSKIKIKENDGTIIDDWILCPGPFDAVYSKEEIEEKVNAEKDVDQQYLLDGYTKTYDKLSFDEIKRIYNNPNSEFYKVFDDYILVKGYYEDANLNDKYTDDYYAKIINDNGVARVYKQIDDRNIEY